MSRLRCTKLKKGTTTLSFTEKKLITEFQECNPSLINDLNGYSLTQYSRPLTNLNEGEFHKLVSELVDESETVRREVIQILGSKADEEYNLLGTSIKGWDVLLEVKDLEECPQKAFDAFNKLDLSEKCTKLGNQEHVFVERKEFRTNADLCPSTIGYTRNSKLTNNNDVLDRNLVATNPSELSEEEIIVLTEEVQSLHPETL